MKTSTFEDNFYTNLLHKKLHKKRTALEMEIIAHEEDSYGWITLRNQAGEECPFFRQDKVFEGNATAEWTEGQTPFLVSALESFPDHLIVEMRRGTTERGVAKTLWGSKYKFEKSPRH